MQSHCNWLSPLQKDSRVIAPPSPRIKNPMIAIDNPIGWVSFHILEYMQPVDPIVQGLD